MEIGNKLIIPLYKVTDNNVNSKLAVMYSRMKFGDSKAISLFAKNLVKIIKREVPEEIIKGDSVVLCHIPTIIKESGLHYVCEEVSKNLGIRIIELKKRKYSFNYQKSAEAKRMRIAKDLIHKKGKILDQKNILLLDDSVVTGTMLKSAEKILFNSGALNIYTFVIIRLSTKNPGEEWLFDTSIYRNNDLKELINLVNDQKNHFTNFLISFIHSLDNSDRKAILDSIDVEIKKKIGQIVRTFPKNTPIGKSELRNL